MLHISNNRIQLTRKHLILSTLLVLHTKLSTCLDDDVGPMVFQFFSSKNVRSIDGILCSSKDKLVLLKYFHSSARKDGYWGFLRTVTDIDLGKIDEDYKWGVFIDLSCPSNQQLLLGDTDERLFANNFCWFIWDDERSLVKNGDHERLPFSTFSDVNVGDREGIVRLHRHKREMPSTLQKVGTWSPEAKNLTIQRWNVRIDFQKTVVRGAIMFIEDVFNHSILQQQLMDDQFKPRSDVSNRFIVGNALHLAYLYNFTLELTIASIWGEPADNGSWSGMIGLVQRKEVDIALSPLMPLPRRMDVSYPSVPVLPYWMAVIFKQPRALGTYRAMILELSPATWACVGILTILGAIVITVTLKHESNLDPSDSSFGMGMLQSLGILATQGLCLVPESNSSRIVCLSMLVVGLLVTTYYNAATMTALLSESPPFIKSLEQLMASQTPLSAVDAPYIRNVPVRRRVFRGIVVEKMSKDLTVCPLDEGIQTILNGSAFLGEFWVLFQAVKENLDGDTICYLTIFNAGFYQKSVSFMKKCPHFRELIIRGLLRTLEHGLTKKERQKWIAGRPVCSRVIQFIHVRLRAVSVAFGVFLIGAGLSTIFYILEIITIRIKNGRSSIKPVEIRDKTVKVNKLDRQF